jgi:hypothetical protein
MGISYPVHHKEMDRSGIDISGESNVQYQCQKLIEIIRMYKIRRKKQV